jgi:hypothetical protein
MSVKKSNDIIGNGKRDLPACTGSVPQPLRVPSVFNVASTNSVPPEFSQILSHFARNDTDYSHGDRTPVFMDWVCSVLICYVGDVHRWSLQFMTGPVLDILNKLSISCCSHT